MHSWLWVDMSKLWLANERRLIVTYNPACMKAITTTSSNSWPGNFGAKKKIFVAAKNYLFLFVFLFHVK